MQNLAQGRLSVVLTILFASTASGQTTWEVNNDTENRWMFKLNSADGLNAEYQLLPGKTVTLTLGDDPHDLETWMYETDPEKKIQPQHLGPVFVRDDNVNRVSQIRSPLKVWGNQQFKDRFGTKIYAAMDGFPYDEEKYGAFLEELRNSEWTGRDGWTLDLSRGRARRPNDRNETVLKNVQYVPGEKFYVVAEWHHDGAKGEMFLVIDPKDSRQLQGNYKYQGKWQGSAIVAQRIGRNPAGNPEPMP